MLYNMGMNYGMIIFFAVFILLREWMCWQDRRDLLNRIMCRDYEEYKRLNRKVVIRKYPSNMSDEMLAAAAREREREEAQEK